LSRFSSRLWFSATMVHRFLPGYTTDRSVGNHNIADLRKDIKVCNDNCNDNLDLTRNLRVRRALLLGGCSTTEMGTAAFP
jgi:hypothetical protein